MKQALRNCIFAPLGAVGLALIIATPITLQTTTEAQAGGNGSSTTTMPEMDGKRGKALFAERGCVICHSVNNVGSDVATSLDASNMNIAREPFEFFARMWRGAPQMLALQQADLGYQIDFSGRDIADIFAFVQSREIQEGFTEQDLPDHIKEIIDNGPSTAID